MDPTLSPTEWKLGPLARKMIQYCYLLEDLTEELLVKEAGGDYEKLRGYLRKRCVDAYHHKVCLNITPLPPSHTQMHVHMHARTIFLNDALVGQICSLVTAHLWWVLQKKMVNDIDPQLMEEAQRFFLLTQTDSLWKEHLQRIKFVQQVRGVTPLIGIFSPVVAKVSYSAKPHPFPLALSLFCLLAPLSSMQIRDMAVSFDPPACPVVADSCPWQSLYRRSGFVAMRSVTRWLSTSSRATTCLWR